MNLIEFLKNTKIEEIQLPQTIIIKLNEAKITDVNRVYTLVQSYKALGKSVADGLSGSDIEIIQQKLNELLIAKGLMRPSRSSSLPDVVIARPPYPSTVKPADYLKLPNKPTPERIRELLRGKPDLKSEGNQLLNSNRRFLENYSEEQSSLIQWEEKFLPNIKKIRLLGEIGISQDDAVEIGKLFRNFFLLFKEETLGSSVSNILETIEQYYPSTFVMFLVSYGIYNYEGGNYWPAISATLRRDVDFNFGRLFERIVKCFGLPVFKELQERSMRYISLILAHGGIPVYCLNDYFENIVLPSITRPQFVGLNGTELIDQILQSSICCQNTDKPVLHFLEFGGRAAENFFERSRKMLVRWQQDHVELTPEETRLPNHVTQSFYKWISNHEIQLETDRSLRSRLRRPELILDPWGLGAFLRLPSQSISALVEADLTWEVLEGNLRETPRVRIIRKENKLETNEITLRTTILPEEFEINFRAGDKVYNWRIQGLTKDHPILTFDPDKGSLQNHIFAREQWVLYPRNMTLSAVDGEAKLLENMPRLPGDWSNLVGECWDFSNAKKLTLSESERLVCEIIVRNHEKVPSPGLIGGSVLSTDPLENDIPIYVGTPPSLSIPLIKPENGIEELSQWRLRIMPVDEADPSENISVVLCDLSPDSFDVDNGIVYLNLNSPSLLGAMPCGTFQIHILGPIGNDADLALRLLPEFHIEDIENFYVPDSYRGSPPVRLKCFTGLTNSIEVANRTDGLNINQLKPGNFDLTIPGGISAVKLIFIHESVGQRIIRVPVNLRLRRLRWRLLSENEITERWTDTITTIPVKAFLQAAAPILLVDLPLLSDNDIGLSLHLLDTNAKEESAPITLEIHKNKGKGRFWRFDLNSLGDVLRHSTSPILRAELRCIGIRGKDDTISIPVLSFTKQIIVKKLEAVSYTSNDNFHICINWEEEFHLHSRVLYLWSLFRPWQPPIVEHIPDSAVGEYEFTIQRRVSPGCLYRLALDVVDPWVISPPPFTPPAEKTPGILDIELMSPQQRLDELIRQPISTNQLGTQFGNRIEAYLTHTFLGELEKSRLDLEWCCLNLPTATSREVLALGRVIRSCGLVNLQIEFGKNVIHPKTLSKLLADTNGVDLLHEELLELLKLAPSYKDWSLDTSELLTRVDDPVVSLSALRQVVSKDIRKGCKLLLDHLHQYQLSTNDAIEILFDEKSKALVILAEFAKTDPLAKRLIELLNMYNPVSGLPTVKIGNWVQTNAGWGRIEGIEDPLSRLSIESFMEGEGHYRLTVRLHIPESYDLTGEKAVVDMQSKKITFYRAQLVFVCQYCNEFITTKQDIYKAHLAMMHGNATPQPPKRTGQVELDFTVFSHERKDRLNE